jgi:hypothetical protein
MGEWSVLEQRINVKLCVKLGKTANDTYAMHSDVYKGEAMKNSSLLCGNIEVVTQSCAYKNAWNLAQRFDSPQ